VKITICSSIDFTPRIKEVSESLVKMGYSVNLPSFSLKIMSGEIKFDDYLKQKQSTGDIYYREKSKEDLIKRYFDFIKKSDAILVLNYDKKGIKNYIGGSVLIEMAFAHVLKKKIYLLNNIPEMSYTDEIKDMKPMVISGDLKKIIN